MYTGHSFPDFKDRSLPLLGSNKGTLWWAFTARDPTDPFVSALASQTHMSHYVHGWRWDKHRKKTQEELRVEDALVCRVCSRRSIQNVPRWRTTGGWLAMSCRLPACTPDIFVFPGSIVSSMVCSKQHTRVTGAHWPIAGIQSQYVPASIRVPSPS